MEDLHPVKRARKIATKIPRKRTTPNSKKRTIRLRQGPPGPAEKEEAQAKSGAETLELFAFASPGYSMGGLDGTRPPADDLFPLVSGERQGSEAAFPAGRLLPPAVEESLEGGADRFTRRRMSVRSSVGWAGACAPGGRKQVFKE